MPQAISVAALVFIRISVVLTLVAFATGTIGFLLAIIGVHTGSVSAVALPVYPVGQQGSFPFIQEDEEAVSLVEKRSSKLSLDL